MSSATSSPILGITFVGGAPRIAQGIIVLKRTVRVNGSALEEKKPQVLGPWLPKYSRPWAVAPGSAHSPNLNSIILDGEGQTRS